MAGVALTVFTPTWNRAHTLPRLYHSLCVQTSRDFEWMVIDDGSTDGTEDLVAGWIAEAAIPVRYIRKENGGLYTGYNVAYANADSELCVCVDSDDCMPEDAVKKILSCWKTRGSDRYAGLIGLDCDYADGKPIGGPFPDSMEECFFMDLHTRKIHRGDTKQVMRTDLMKQVAPQEGFPGERNFNPVYMLLQVCDKYPLLVLNECLCLVEYQQADSMSRNIWHQYADSPRSFAKLRRLEMELEHNTFADRFRSAVHYVAESMVASDRNWLKDAPRKPLVLFATLPGVVMYMLIKMKGVKTVGWAKK